MEKQVQSLWSPKERKCLALLHQKPTRISLLQIHAFMLRNAIDANVNLLTKFITVCSSTSPKLADSDSFSGIRYARQVFDQRLHRDDTFLCNSMIKSHLGMRQFDESITLYRDLRGKHGFLPDSFTFSSLVRCCGLNLATREGQLIHCHVTRFGLCSDLFLMTCLVDMYAKFGDMGCARKVFDDMTERSQVSWTALIVGYARSGDMGNAREFFNLMPEKDTGAFNAMLDAYGKLGDMGSAKFLFDDMPERNVVSWTTLISGFCNNEDVDSARRLFDAMPEKNLFSWNAMIGGYCRNKQPREAMELFRELQSDGTFEPDEVTIVSILPAIADLGDLDLGNWVHQLVRRRKLHRATNVSTALIDMYAKCGDIVKAKRIFEEIPKKETAMWNALINGFAVNGDAKEALEVFSEMKRRGYKPNDITMLSVLSACNHNGLVEEGKRWFKAMEEFGLTPKIEHYGCMIDLLGRARLLEEAENLIKTMPYEANGIILSSFLFACGHSKDITKAEKVMKKAIELEPGSDGNYVILRNMYAVEGRWRDVKEIKGLMRRNGARKEAGCSVIEIENRVWEFVAGDTMQPHWEEIHFLLRQFRLHMKGQVIV